MTLSSRFRPFGYRLKDYDLEETVPVEVEVPEVPEVSMTDAGALLKIGGHSGGIREG